MTLPIGVQLYSVREEAKQDYEGTIRKVAALGYVGVEPAGFQDSSARAAAALYRELGLEVPSAHGPLPVGDDKNQVLDDLAALGCPRLISGRGPDDFATLDAVKATCELFNEAAANAEAAGLTFGIHNHWWEYDKQIDGKLPAELMHELLTPNVFFEIDTYWVKTGGADPAAIVAQFGERVQLLHIKDGPCRHGEPMTAIGAGTMDFAPIVAAATHCKYLIVELDACATDMLEAIAQSFDYLKGAGLGHGK